MLDFELLEFQIERPLKIKLQSTAFFWYIFVTEVFLLFTGIMAPNATNTVEETGVLNEGDAETYDGGLMKDITVLKGAEKRKLKLVWRNILAFAYVHVAAVYGAWLMLSSARLYTTVFGNYLNNLNYFIV